MNWGRWPDSVVVNAWSHHFGWRCASPIYLQQVVNLPHKALVIYEFFRSFALCLLRERVVNLSNIVLGRNSLTNPFFLADS